MQGELKGQTAGGRLGSKVVAALLMGTALGAITVMVLAPAQAQTAQQRTFAIRPQPLPSALTVFGQQTGLQVSVDAAAARGLTSPGATGTMTPAVALHRLLAGTGLSYRFTGASTVVIGRPGAQAGGANVAGAISLDTIDVQGASLTSDPSSTEGSQSYAAPVVSIGRERMRLIDLPQSATVLTRQQLDDQNIRTVTDALEALPGLTVTQQGNIGNVIYSRGFQITKLQTDGGNTQDLFSSNYFRGVDDLTQYDHVEFLRGSDALFSGSGDPSGTINLVRKRPLPHQAVSIQAAVGSWEEKRGAIDFSVPLTSDSSWGARFVGSYSNRSMFYKPSGEERLTLYGVVEYKPSDTTSIRMGGSYDSRDIVFVLGLPRYSTGEPVEVFNRKTALAAPWNLAEYRYVEAFAGVDSEISDNWRLRFNASFIDQDFKTQYRLANGAIDPVQRLVTFQLPDMRDTARKNYSTDLTLSGKVPLFGREHDVIVGGDYRYSPKYYREWQVPGSPTRISLDNLAQGMRTLLSRQPGNDEYRPYYFIDNWNDTQYGVYGKFKFNLTDRLSLIAGGRYSHYENFSDDVFYDIFDNGTAYPYGKKARPQSVFTPYAAAVFALSDNWNTYFSYADIFANQSDALDVNHQPLSPMRGETFELGTKKEFFGGRLIASAALYYTEKTNVGVQISSESVLQSRCCFAAIGKQVSKGLDLELAGEVMPNWSLQLGYTYNENEIERGTNAGAFINPNTPRHLLKLATNYRFSGGLEGLTIGGSILAQSQNFASGSIYARRPDGSLDTVPTPFSFVQPGYAVVGLNASYRLSKNLTAQINVSNLLDKTYYQTVGTTAFGNYFGEPRRFTMTLRGNF
jgi:outer membrane receptor for ferric coprogen and ferric-rhodotorulic acid